MAYQCVKSGRECDGCQECKPDYPACPNCNSKEYESMFYAKNDWIGCDECVQRRYA